MAIFRVTTQGDEAGRTERDLGIWEGNPLKIAQHLADRAYHSLYFKKEEIQKPNTVTGDNVIFYLNKSEVDKHDFEIDNDTQSIKFTEFSNASVCVIVKSDTFEDKIKRITSTMTKADLKFIKENIGLFLGEDK